ncbi:uncharacterized protein N0V89_012163 [Didymosphaeria variabile]|uniref:Uncharacterized protein n=1 Tax=Didymosphaeria variabile TaxID=1932322 RepID=A0A9W8X927_9PLEO|nr:uncharacterized protein N0V89_012163 [Didymosphaeria variabile]KAJ4344421.1 hypothetical protein N0V89_012163 [Didymosphaeria variabile]
MNVLAAKDQENFVHGLQTAAASKPLNAGLKGFAAKTPAKKVPLNDENAVAKGGKSVLQTKGRGNENLFVTGKKDGKLDSNAFVTPAGPRTRAPLGMKTTNAKAKAFQTPVPLSASAKTQKASPRLRRPKVKVQPDVQHAGENDVPEVEYMPPKEVPLLDDMGDYLPRDWKIPKLENGGVEEAYRNPLEDDGRTKLQREFEEKLERDIRKRDEEFDRVLDQQMEQDQLDVARHFGVALPQKVAPKSTLIAAEPTRTKATGPSTLKAKSAAAALSEPRRPAYAAQTAATKSRLPSKPVAGKKSINNPSATRHEAATAASKSTIGYAQGRENAASKLQPRKPLSNVTKPAPFSVVANRAPSASSMHKYNASTSSVVSKPRGPFSRSSSTSTNATLVAPPQAAPTYRTAEDIERELELMLLRDDDNDGEEAWANSFSSVLGGRDPFDEDVEDFQFQLPEGL